MKNDKAVRLAAVAPVTACKPQLFEGTRRYYATGDVGPEGELSEPKQVTFDERPSRAGCMPVKGDVGFARMKGTKKVVEVTEAVAGSLFSTGFCFLSPFQEIDPRFLFYFLVTDEFQGAKDVVAGDGIMGGGQE
ncbi:MAG: hypothetical protein M3R13_02920, partial [Armatimonadota bacterium]|nr:hypothetical protein [Armatimonadota bacterium]